MKNHHIAKLLFAATILATILGCHDPSLEIAREAARRQAEQNHEMARVTTEAAAGTRRLVQEQGQARRDMTAVHRDLHAERSQLSASWNALEAQRQSIAASRRTESFLASVLRGGGSVLAALLALGVAWLTLFGLHRHDDSAEASPYRTDFLTFARERTESAALEVLSYVGFAKVRVLFGGGRPNRTVS